MLKKTKKIAQKLKTMKLVHRKVCNSFLKIKVQSIITNLLAFFQFFPQKFTTLDLIGIQYADPDPQLCEKVEYFILSASSRSKPVN